MRFIIILTMLKKTTLSLVLFTIFGISLSYSANPPKSGASCSKSGITQTYQGKKYTCVKSGKKLVWNKGEIVIRPTPSPSAVQSSLPLSLPTSSFSPTPTSTINPIPKSITYTSPEELSVCRVPQKEKDPNIPFYAYPIDEKSIYAMVPKNGPINVAVIPIDFPDAPGGSSPNTFFDSQRELIDQWMLWYSHGKSLYKWQTHNTWIRAPRVSTDYVPINTPGPTRGNSNDGRSDGNFIGTRRINTFEAASELLNVSEKYFNLEKINTVLFLFPESAKNLYDPWITNGNFQGSGSSRDGTYKDLGIRDKRLVNVVIAAAGNWFYNQRVSFWPWFLHEHLHNQGLLGHAPRQGSPLGIMTNQMGVRLPLQTWDSIILDWQLPTDIYCVRQEKLTRTEIIMSPLEREEIGTKAIMIRLSQFEILVIESRRDDKWINKLNSKEIINADKDGRSKNFNGLVVYKVQVDKVDPYGTVDPDGVNWKDSSPNFAYYIRNNITDKGFSDFSGSEPFDLNFIINEGETLNYRGIKISLIKSQEHDTVVIDRN